jgi:hypothetical protein
MDNHETDVVSRDRVIAALIELIDALDRRVPHVERAGEIAIAREAAALKKGALARIDELKRAGSTQKTREVTLANEVMSDDGGPAIKG